MAKRSHAIPDRALRVADQIQRDVSEILFSEVKDPSIGLVTLTEVNVSPDYAQAKIYYTTLPDDAQTIEKTQQHLNRASGFIRAQLGKRLHIHTLPRLTFVYDKTVSQGQSLMQLIEKANATPVKDDDVKKE